MVGSEKFVFVFVKKSGIGESKRTEDLTFMNPIRSAAVFLRERPQYLIKIRNCGIWHHLPIGKLFNSYYFY